MGIDAKFTQADVSKRFDKFIAVIEKRQVERMMYLGEKCVTHAKLIPELVGFTDQTGALRSSIGYAVFKDGVAVHMDYQQVGEGAEGVKKGQALAAKVAKKYPKGILLVVTAGMEYAIYVESKGRDVLSSAEHLAQQELPKMIKALKENINKALK